VDALLHNMESIDRWTQFMHTQFHFSRATAYSLFYPSRADVIHQMTLAYERALTPYKPANITEDVTYARKTSTYIQHVWARKWSAYHPVYDMAHVPYDTYMHWIRLRTLTLALPVYNIYAGVHPPFTSRTCCFGCPQPGDIHHLLIGCPHTSVHLVCSRSHSRSTPTTVADLFDASKFDLHDIVHNATYPVHLVQGTLTALGEAAEP
jgi:hypothetical protein